MGEEGIRENHRVKRQQDHIFRRVCPEILAGLKFCGVGSCPVGLPLVAVTKVGEGGNGLGVVEIPASSGTFQAGGARLAAGFRGTAADLPTVGGELGVVDHVAALGDVVQQLFGGGSFVAAERSQPLQQMFVSRFVALVFEGVQQGGGPGLSGGVLAAEHTAASVMNVFRQVVEVQAASVQLQLSGVQLRRNPARAIDVGDPFVRVQELQSHGLATQQRADLRLSST